MRDGRTGARLALLRDAAVLLVAMAGVVLFLVVGGTLVWAVTGSADACREEAGVPERRAEAVSTAGWSWEPAGMRCVVRRADGSADEFVVTPW
jgi:hypothetical protein